MRVLIEEMYRQVEWSFSAYFLNEIKTWQTLVDAIKFLNMTAWLNFYFDCDTCFMQSPTIDTCVCISSNHFDA